MGRKLGEFMSVIAVRKYEDRIEFYADSIVLSGDLIMSKLSADTTKLFSDNGMVVGACGSTKEFGIMEHFVSSHNPSTADVRGVREFMWEFGEWKKKKFDDFNIENVYIIVYGQKALSEYKYEKDKVFML